MSDPGTDPATEALQVALGAEHAAVFVYGALGGQTSQSATPGLFTAVTDAYDLHRERRDALEEMLRAAGADPVPAEPGYELPADLGSPTAVAARARELEQAAASTYAFLVGNTTGEARAWAVAALTDAALRGLGFGAKPVPFPGL